MRQYLARRLLLFIPTLFLASLGIFTAMRVIPGDVAVIILAGEESIDMVSQEQFDNLRRELGLSDPLPLQYGKWVWSMVNGEFGGRSLLDKEPMSEVVVRRGLVTLQLAFYTIVLSMVAAVPLGVIAAVKQDKWPDYAIRIFTITGHALPNFWLALLTLLFLVLYFHWSPPLRYQPFWDSPWNHFQKVIWPVLILSWGYSSNITRIARSSMLEVLRQDYIRTARSKGLRNSIVLWRHALRNAIIPVVTLGGLLVGGLLSGTVILEAIFGLPGIGQGIVQSATLRDYPVIQSLAMLLVVIMLSLNLLIDIIYAYIDPRITYS
jgi:peptide/nickel transport system permease protein